MACVFEVLEPARCRGLPIAVSTGFRLLDAGICGEDAGEDVFLCGIRAC